MDVPVWQQITIPAATAAIAWFGSKMQTRRERKQSDLQIIDNAIAPLLTSIKDLTARNNEFVQMYLEEQKIRLETQSQNEQLIKDRNTLSVKVEKLTLKIEKLERTISKLTNGE